MSDQLEMTLHPERSDRDNAARHAERARYLARLREYLKGPELRCRHL